MEKSEVRWTYISGRLAGLAGTVRYDLEDEDRDFLRELSKLLERYGK